MRTNFSIFLSLIFITSILFQTKAQNKLHIPDTLTGTVINLTLQKGSKQFFAGRNTETMGVNGNILGPTVVLNKYQQVTMNVTNNLGEITTIHWHGMHVAPENDGGPHIVIPVNATWSPSFQVLDHASTHWYHPHLHEKTHDHVQKGIAGFIIVRDSQEARINLPRTYGVDDIPLCIQTKSFDTSYQIVTAHVASDTVLMVNATLNPYVDLPPQVVRLRLLNGSSERSYNIGFSNNATFAVIAADGGLLPAPVNLTRMMLSPGERAEILVDLSELKNQTIYLRNYGTGIPNGNYGAAQPGMGPGQQIPGYTTNLLNGRDFNILQINVLNNSSANAVTSIPSTLITHNSWPESAAQATRTLTFTSMTMGQGAINGPFVINNQHFDMNVINIRVPFNNIEIWELRNQTPISHPFHIHNVPFYILSINGQAPPPQHRGRKDVVLVPGGNGVVRFITRFEDFYNDTLPYMYHCHMLTHEDDGMMGQYVVQSPCDLIAAHPENKTATIGSNVTFSVQTKGSSMPDFKWQTNIGFGFQDLQNAGQYNGVNTNTLSVNNITSANNNQFFRCIVSNSTCEQISNQAVLTLATAVSEIQHQNLLQIVPNPASFTFSVLVEPNTKIDQLTVFDLNGKEVLSLKDMKDYRNIDISSLNEGIYLVQLAANNSLYNARLIKQ